MTRSTLQVTRVVPSPARRFTRRVGRLRDPRLA